MLPRNTCGVRSFPPGPAPHLKVLVPPVNSCEGVWIIWAPFQGPVRCESGGGALPNNLQPGGRCVPPELDIFGSSDRGGSGSRYRGVWAGHSTDGGILLCQLCNTCKKTGTKAEAGSQRPGRAVWPVWAAHQRWKYDNNGGPTMSCDGGHYADYYSIRIMG